MYSSGDVLTDKEYRNLCGMYGFGFIAEYLNKCQSVKEIERRVLSLKNNFEKLKECNRYLSFQKMLYVSDGGVKSQYKKSCSRIHNELMDLYDDLNKEDIIDVVGGRKFTDIFIYAMLIDMRSFEGDRLPSYFFMFDEDLSREILYEFIYSNFIGNKTIRSTIYGLYKKLFKKEYKKKEEHIEGELIPLKKEELNSILNILDEENFKNFIDEIIPSIRYYDLIEDKDNLIKNLMIRLIKNFVYITTDEKESPSQKGILMGEYNLTTPLFVIKTDEIESNIVYQNLYEDLMENKYYS